MPKTTKRSLINALSAPGPIGRRLSKQVQDKIWMVNQLVDTDFRADQNGEMVDHYLVDWDLSNFCNSRNDFEFDLSWEPHYNISRDLIDDFHKQRGQQHLVIPPIDYQEIVRINPARVCKKTTAASFHAPLTSSPALMASSPALMASSPALMASSPALMASSPAPLTSSFATTTPSASQSRRFDAISSCQGNTCKVCTFDNADDAVCCLICLTLIDSDETPLLSPFSVVSLSPVALLSPFTPFSNPSPFLLPPTSTPLFVFPSRNLSPRKLF